MAESEQAKVSLTEEEVKLLQASWEILAEDKKTNGVKLFIKLFRKYPAAQDKFRAFKNVSLEDLDYDGETTKKNRKMVAHGMSVMYALESYIDSLDDMDCLVELVRKTAKSHLDRSIGVKEFMWMIPVTHELIDYVTDGRENVNVGGVKKAWTKIMTMVADIVEIEANADTSQQLG
ncbi:globin-like [Pecten maximus]|uniref:globin-like n=1 Tax=Pecten maximus TaxID=6579 RepID=UPI001458D41A|nr:globin-like [Pecten maximus]XP_033744579.1 globin-like [Pecten maximus]